MNDLRTAAQQALEVMSDISSFERWSEAKEALRAALAEPQEHLVESALQAVAEKIGDQCAVWYGIGARDVEAVLREAVRHGLVHGARAEPVANEVHGCHGGEGSTLPAEPVQEPVACAQVCEEMRPSKSEFDRRYYDACTDSAAAIRARSNT